MSTSDSRMYHNPYARKWTNPKSPPEESPLAFHQSFHNFNPTNLTEIPAVARELGLHRVYLKDESNRLDLPSFKILGASWATFRCLTHHLQLPLSIHIDDLKLAMQSERPCLYAATDGNHGRAVARMANLLDLKSKVYVPRGIPLRAMQHIRDEGAEVIQLDSNYDEAVITAYHAAGRDGGLCIQDTSFEGYEQVPSWIVEGYSTMMYEIDDQLGSRQPDLVIVPVGVGSLAQSVVAHYKATNKSTSILTVEPDSAACLWTSLNSQTPVQVQTSTTIMSGLDCGTVSHIAWPTLKAGVDASLTVSDEEVEQAIKVLRSLGICAGPCGAAPLAALRRLSDEQKAKLGLDCKSIVVLLCTEGEGTE